MTAPTWLPTARALAAVWDGPELAQFVVSEGPGVLEVEEYDHRGLPCEAVTTYPDRDTVPDLGSNAVGGEVLAALPVGWSCTSERDGTFAVRPAFGDRSEGATFGEAAALAFVAAR